MRSEWLDIGDELKQELTDRLEVAGQIVESAAVALCPTGDTSDLKNSLTHEVDENELCVRIGTNVEYAPHVEFGTGEFAEDGQGRKGGWVYNDGKGFHFTLGNKPQPYLRPALEENKEQLKRILEA